MAKKTAATNPVTVVKLRQQLIERNKLNSERLATLRDRLKSRADELLKLRADQFEAIKKMRTEFQGELKKSQAQISVLQRQLAQQADSDEGQLIAQLDIKNNLLRSRTANLNDTKQRVTDLEAVLFQSKPNPDQAFSPDMIILKLLAKGYYKRGRYQYLDFVSQKDWENLLEFFQSKSDGFEALEALRPLFRPWIQYYHGLIDVIEDQGFKIRPLEDYIDNGLQEKSLYLYHDVHAWDLIPALGMALANKDRGICTTFCLNIDQAHVDIAHEAGYRIFGTLFGEHVQVGLHCNPMASWVRMDVFQADEKAFMDWFTSDNAKEELTALLQNKKTNVGAFAGENRRSAMNGSFKRLDTNFKKLKTFCPQARAANHHGDILNQFYKTMDKKLKDKNAFIIVPSILRDKKVKKIGIQVSPTNIRVAHKPIAEIYDESKNKEMYYENLHEILGQGLSYQLINHPGAISNNVLTTNLEFAKKLKNHKFDNYPPFTAHVAKKMPASTTAEELDDCDDMTDEA